MTVTLLRHGQTADNAAGRYQGSRRDTSLSPAGLAALRQADASPAVVYVSPLLRARQTAAVLFPNAEQVPADGLREMDFGVFEGRTWQEMVDDAAYRAWVDSGCTSRCPGGEDKAAFTARTCAAFAALVNAALAEHASALTVVAHGGTQMAVLERWGTPKRDYYQWQASPAGGYVLDTADWPRTLRVIKTVQYLKSNIQKGTDI